MPVAIISRLLSLTLATGLILVVSHHSTPACASDAQTARDALMMTDFTPDTANLGWYVQNDNVMGGRSEGSFTLAPGKLVFSGSTNTNGGGFSSIRTESMQADLSGYAGIRLRFMGDGRRYTWHLQTNALWRNRRISYWADFETVAEQWQDVYIPFTDIYDKLDGPFALTMSLVGTFSADKPLD